MREDLRHIIVIKDYFRQFAPAQDAITSRAKELGLTAYVGRPLDPGLSIRARERRVCDSRRITRLSLTFETQRPTPFSTT